MTGQPDFCNRCGDRLDPNGISCYQKHCNYKKYSEDNSDDSDYDDGYELEINNQDFGSTDNSFLRKKLFNRDKEVESTESDDNDDSDSDGGNSSSHGSDKGGCLDLDGLGDGCIGGFLKVIWKVITFPIRVILWIAEIFD
ncbi:MAG: hypothetical protein ACPG19_05750 [Saprospiraceae bacterium]